MAENNGLVEKVVMAYVPGAIQIGRQDPEDTQMFKGPYLTITKELDGSNIKITPKSGPIKDTPIEYSHGALEKQLISFGCHGVPTSEFIADMVGGGYAEKRTEEQKVPDPSI